MRKIDTLVETRQGYRNDQQFQKFNSVTGEAQRNAEGWIREEQWPQYKRNENGEFVELEFFKDNTN